MVQVELVLCKPVCEFFGPGPEHSDHSVQEQRRAPNNAGAVAGVGVRR